MYMWEVKLSKESHELQSVNQGREKEYWERYMVHASNESKF